jgi:Helix-turn-helix domain
MSGRWKTFIQEARSYYFGRPHNGIAGILEIGAKLLRNNEKGCVGVRCGLRSERGPMQRLRSCAITHSKGECRRCLRLISPNLELYIPLTKSTNRTMIDNIGQRLRRARESRGMTLRQLYACSRVSCSLMSRIEKGQITPTLATLERISDAIDVGLNRLFTPAT